jgi:hypothetical protein
MAKEIDDIDLSILDTASPTTSSEPAVDDIDLSILDSGSPAAMDNTKTSKTETALRSAAQGAVPFRLQDELSGAGEAGLGFFDVLLTGSNNFGDQGRLAGIASVLDNYKQARDTQRQQYDKAAADNPNVALAADLTAGLLTSGAYAPVSAALKGATLAKAATIGAGMGAATSLGASAGSMLDPMVYAQALEDAAKGGVLNLVLPAAAQSLRGGKTAEELITRAAKSNSPAAASLANKILGSEVALRAANLTADGALAAAAGAGAGAAFGNADSFTELVDNAKDGAMYSIALWGAGRGLKATGQKVNEAFIKTRKAKAMSDVLQKEQQIKLAKTDEVRLENNAQFIDEKLKQAETQAKTLPEKLDNLRVEQGKLNAVIQNADDINYNISKLAYIDDDTPGDVVSALNKQKATFGAKQGEIVKSLPDQDITADVFSTINAIKNEEAFTPRAQQAKAQALQILNGLASRGQKTMGSPVLNIPSKTTIVIPASEVNAAKQQLQDILYNRETWKDIKGTTIANTMKSFERGVRDKLVKADGTGELGRVNQVLTNLNKATEFAKGTFSENFLRSTGTNPAQHKTKVNQFLSYLTPQDEISTGFKSKGLPPGLKEFPDELNPILTTRAMARAAIETNTGNYGMLKQAQRVYPKVTGKIQQTEQNILRADEQITRRKLTRSSNESRLRSLGQTISEKETQLGRMQENMPKNILDVILGDKANLYREAAGNIVSDPLVQIPLSVGKAAKDTVIRSEPALGMVSGTINALGRSSPQPTPTEEEFIFEE